MRRRVQSLVRLALCAWLSTVLLAGLSFPVAAADTVQGTVGAYRMNDSRSDPSTLCAYPVGGSRLKQFRARGPRVDFPDSVGQVGWVEWRTIVQRLTEAGTWRAEGDVRRIRRTVTVGFTKTFPTIDVKVAGPSGQAQIRLVNRLDWFDQGDKRVGRVRHVAQHYGWDRFDNEVVNTDMLSFDQIARRSFGSCPNRWYG
jgi:hypothetical protein